jgi:hypothetical protein
LSFFLLGDQASHENWLLNLPQAQNKGEHARFFLLFPFLFHEAPYMVRRRHYTFPISLRFFLCLAPRFTNHDQQEWPEFSDWIFGPSFQIEAGKKPDAHARTWVAPIVNAQQCVGAIMT